jgi:hypothetical protein
MSGRVTVPDLCRPSSENIVVQSFVYLGLKRLIELVLLCFRSSDATEVEILVLRHELEATANGANMRQPGLATVRFRRRRRAAWSGRLSS